MTVPEASTKTSSRTVLANGTEQKEWPAAGKLDDDIWTELRRLLPAPLPEETDAILRNALEGCLSRLAAAHLNMREGGHLATIARRPTKRQLAPVEALATHLQAALDAWNKIGGTVSTVRSPFDGLASMAAYATQLATNLKELPTQAVIPPWPVFVRSVAHALNDAGFQTPVTGTGYDYDSSRSWFQKFIAAFNDKLPKLLHETSASPAAFDKKTLRAIKGDIEPG